MRCVANGCLRDSSRRFIHLSFDGVHRCAALAIASFCCLFVVGVVVVVVVANGARVPNVDSL